MCLLVFRVADIRDDGSLILQGVLCVSLGVRTARAMRTNDLALRASISEALRWFGLVSNVGVALLTGAYLPKPTLEILRRVGPKGVKRSLIVDYTSR